MFSTRRRLLGHLALPVLLAFVPAACATATEPRRAAPPVTAPRQAGAPTDRTYALGIRTEVFVDHTRPTPANGSYGGAPDRTLVTTVLYPTDGEPGGTERENATPSRRGGPFPLLVFSHGFGSRGPDYLFLLRRIAAHGYVVAAPTFPLSSRDAPGGPTVNDVVHQPRDVSFVISRMIDLSRERGTFHSVVDSHRIGVAGHSLGGITTLSLVYSNCCPDPRIDAAVPMSSLQLPWPGLAFTWPSVPLLLTHGDRDQTVPYTGSVDSFGDAKAPKFLLTLEGAPHSPFGAPWIDPLAKSIVDFLDRYVRNDPHDNDPHALDALQRDGNVPGVAHLDAEPR